MSLCFRCQHRVNFLEKKYQPRCECGMIDRSVYSCYMFTPVQPIEITKSDHRDIRPLFASCMFSCRITPVKNSTVKYKLIAKAIDKTKRKETYVLYWSPRKKKI